VLNPVPVTPLLGDDSDLTVAVHFGGGPVPGSRAISAPETSSSLIPTGLQEKIRQFMQKLQSSEPGETKQEWGTYDVAMQSIEAMQIAIAQQKLAAFPPDVLIEIPRNACRMLEYDRAGEMIALGYERAASALSEHVC
jgi:NTE family protein